ncbi:hypothetical protein E2320_006355 [Naja naja]|nr:hypothetical protein E2320_006355 [Naja naja]
MQPTKGGQEGLVFSLEVGAGLRGVRSGWARLGQSGTERGASGNAAELCPSVVASLQCLVFPCAGHAPKPSGLQEKDFLSILPSPDIGLWGALPRVAGPASLAQQTPSFTHEKETILHQVQPKIEKTFYYLLSTTEKKYKATFKK